MTSGNDLSDLLGWSAVCAVFGCLPLGLIVAGVAALTTWYRNRAKRLGQPVLPLRRLLAIFAVVALTLFLFAVAQVVVMSLFMSGLVDEIQK